MRLDEAIYRFFLERRRAKFESRAVQVEGCFVVSVGNLTSGGTGKTPMVQHLARGLQHRGARVAVVARGWGGTLSAKGAVVSDGETLFCDARQAGDEAVLHARSLPGVGVVIGRDRVAATQRAVRELGCDAVVLDDSFQFWSLQRDLDLVLLDARRPFGNGHLLPRGRLREPVEALNRADAVVLTRRDLASPEQLARNRVLVSGQTTAPLYVSNHVPTGLRDEANGKIFGLERLRDSSAGVLSAIADNKGFSASLHQLGARILATSAHFDHHHWRENEVRQFALQAHAKGALALITTEKDAVKLSAAWCAPLPLWSLVIEVEVEEDELLWAQIDAVFENGKRKVKEPEGYNLQNPERE
jgi:tetraacyldisaccharide 4'-kinase